MIVFYDETGAITGFQTYPPVYNGDLKHIVVDDETDLTGMKVEDGKLVLQGGE